MGHIFGRSVQPRIERAAVHSGVSRRKVPKTHRITAIPAGSPRTVAVTRRIPVHSVWSFVVLMALALFACTPRPAATERTGRIISLTDKILSMGGTDTVRFGHMRSGEIAVMQFWIENNATRATAITSFARSCGCTSFEFDPQPITPGEAQRVKLIFDSRGERGWQLKTLDITLAGAAKPLRLFVEADIE